MPVLMSSAPVGSKSKNFRAFGNGAGDGHAPLLAARELRGKVIEARAEIHQRLALPPTWGRSRFR
jgi:hypothetical protein